MGSGASSSSRVEPAFTKLQEEVELLKSEKATQKVLLDEATRQLNETTLRKTTLMESRKTTSGKQMMMSTSSVATEGAIQSTQEKNRTPYRIAKSLRKTRGRESSCADSSKTDSQNIFHLPRGGVYVNSKAGPVQFGIPPETVKDSMNLGFEVPTFFVVPRERFNLSQGINVSELEFPAFFNFFVRKRQVTLITAADCSNDLRNIMKEALNGPEAHELYTEEEYSRFASPATRAAMPDHVKEIDYFREPRAGTPTIEIDSLIKFAYFDSMGECDLGNDVVVKDEQFGFTLYQDGQIVATVSDDEAGSCFVPPSEGPAVPDEEEVSMFTIPRFGITILGNSHGFDPKGSTSGFVIWINGQGIMVDPPPHSGEILKQSGIQPKLITATILTHCHADHDAGTIQKIITEGKITLMTTKTVFNSLLRKYAGVAGLAPSFLRQLVDFRPVFVEEPTYWGGASFRFFYSLHAIPCVGFEVSFEGKRIVYSADTYFEPDGLVKIRDRGILSQARCDALMNFPWDADIVLHEAGVPPIHTPISAFDTLPEEYQKNIRLIHIGTKEQADAVAKGYKMCLPGIKNTTVLLESVENHETFQFLQLISSVDIFKGFRTTQALELFFMSNQVSYAPGQVIAEKGTPGDKFMIILSGEASVTFGPTKKFFRVGDYLGEISIMTGEERTATIAAETKCTVIEIDKYAFHYLIGKDQHLDDRMRCLVKSRIDGSWHAIAQNSILRMLSVTQKTSLQAFLHIQSVAKDEVIWAKGQSASCAVLILSGNFILEEIHRVDPYELMTSTRHPHKFNANENQQVIAFDPLTVGTFICDALAITTDVPLTVSLVCDSDEGVIFKINRDNLIWLLDSNPMLLLSLLKQ